MSYYEYGPIGKNIMSFLLGGFVGLMTGFYGRMARHNISKSKLNAPRIVNDILPALGINAVVDIGQKIAGAKLEDVLSDDIGFVAGVTTGMYVGQIASDYRAEYLEKEAKGGFYNSEIAPIVRDAETKNLTEAEINSRLETAIRNFDNYKH